MKISYAIMLAGLIPAIASAADNAAGTATTNAATTQTAPATSESKTVAPAAAATQKQDLAEQSGFSKGSVMRSIFTNEIKDREPTNKINSTDSDKVFYFTELRDMNGQTATHRWEHDGKVISEMKFNVGSNRWRVWSSKTFQPSTAGNWKVSVLNGVGEVIAEESIKIGTSAEAAMPAKSAAPAVSSPSSDVQPAPAKAAQ